MNIRKHLPATLAVAVSAITSFLGGCAVDPEPVPDYAHFERHQRGFDVDEADRSLAGAKIQSIPIGPDPSRERPVIHATTIRTSEDVVVER